MRKFVGGFSNDAIKLVIRLVDSKGKTPSPLLWTSDLPHRCAFHVGVRVQQPCAACPQSQLFSRAVQSLLKVWALPRHGVAAFVQILTRLNVQFLNAATWTCFSVSHCGVRVVLDLCRRGKSKIILCSFSYPPPPPPNTERRQNYFEMKEYLQAWLFIFLTQTIMGLFLRKFHVYV